MAPAPVGARLLASDPVHARQSFSYRFANLVVIHLFIRRSEVTEYLQLSLSFNEEPQRPCAAQHLCTVQRQRPCRTRKGIST